MTKAVKFCAVILAGVTSLYGGQTHPSVNRPTPEQKPAQQPTSIVQEPTVLGTGDTWAVISWTTNARGKAYSKIYAGTDRNNLQPIHQTVAEPANAGQVVSYQEQEYSHLVRLNDLKPGTTYYFVADSGSASNHGPESKSNTWSFTTSAPELAPSPALDPQSTVAQKSPAVHTPKAQLKEAAIRSKRTPRHHKKSSTTGKTESASLRQPGN